MHKKSLDAAQKLQEEEELDMGCSDTASVDSKDHVTPDNNVGGGGSSGGGPTRGVHPTPAVVLDPAELRSDSIASLRAKAQSYHRSTLILGDPMRHLTDAMNLDESMTSGDCSRGSSSSVYSSGQSLERSFEIPMLKTSASDRNLRL